MDKYTLLLILNLPFVVFGLVKALAMFKNGTMPRLSLLIRIIFWFVILFGLFFAESIYNILFANNLTDTAPLSLADVVLVTGVMFALFLCMRLYAKIDILEKRLSDLHEEVSIIHSD